MELKKGETRYPLLFFESINYATTTMKITISQCVHLGHTSLFFVILDPVRPVIVVIKRSPPNQGRRLAWDRWEVPPQGVRSTNLRQRRQLSLSCHVNSRRGVHGVAPDTAKREAGILADWEHERVAGRRGPGAAESVEDGVYGCNSATEKSRPESLVSGEWPRGRSVKLGKTEGTI